MTGLKAWLWLLGVLVVTGICYVEIPRADFVYDDGTFIIRNQTLRTMKPLSKFFTNKKSYSADGRFAIYRPLPALSYAIDYQIGYALDELHSRPNPKGTPNPTVFHVTNVVAHLINAGLVFLLLLMLFGNAPAAALGAMFFAVHPLNIESVSWISRRGNVFFLLFALIAFCLHIRLNRASNRKGKGKRKGYLYAGVLGCYTLSLLSQELAIILPGLLLSYDLLLGPPERRKLSKLAAYYVPMIVLAALYLWGRHEVLGKTAQQGFHGDSFFITMYTMCKVFVTYLRQMFVPTGLAVNYAVPLSESFLDARALASLGVLLALVASAALLFKRVPLYSFCVGWFFITLAPVSNVIPLQALQNDRFLYMTTVGLSIGLAGLLAWSMSRKDVSKVNALSIVLSVILGAAVLTGAVMTFRQNRIWQNHYSLWSAAVAAQPNSYIARNNLGNCYQRQGKLKRAIVEWEVALTLHDKPYISAYNMVGAYLELNKSGEALKAARLSVKYAPELCMTRLVLAKVLDGMGRFDEAVLAYQHALKGEVRKPHQKYAVHASLAKVYLKRSHGDDLKKALKHVEAAWELHKDADVAFVLVAALRRNWHIKEAKKLALYWRRRLPTKHPLRAGFEHELRLMDVQLIR